MRRLLRLWPGAYFTWPSRRQYGWIDLDQFESVLKEHYLPVLRDQLNRPSALGLWVTANPYTRRRKRPVGVRP